jgi:eukaryotic-like serine/threonine-protein kinase
VKLLDFGLAKAFEGDVGDINLSNAPTIGMTATNVGLILGTVAYMSPEQAQGKAVDKRSDIFSFGTVLYELVSGKRPFTGGSTAEVLSAVLRDEPTPVNAPDAIAAILRRCLAKRAADRFASMAELKTALDRIATSSPAALNRAKPSIAVLPFANISGDKEQEYFSDGLAEEIINALVKIPNMRVIARTSAFAFKGQNTDVRKIAETLDVANILEGSVRRSGNRIRVTAQLITAADGSHLWSERYDRELADVFAVQDEISVAIANALQTRLSPQPTAKRYTPKLPAYEALLKAKHFHWKVTAESMDQANKFYQQAIALDPQYALARAGYADYLCGRAVMGLSPAHEVMPTARALAQRALELEPTLPEAHSILCLDAGIYSYNWKEAADRFRLIGDSASPWCHMICGWSYFLGSGHPKEAMQEFELAVLADPLYVPCLAWRAMCLGTVGQYGEAEEQLRQAKDLDPNFFWASYFLAELYAARQMFAEALPHAERSYSLAPWHMPCVGLYAGVLVRTGQPERANEVLQQLGSGASYGASTALAIYHICCGEIEAAADCFEKAIEERYSMVVSFLQGAIGEPLRASSRWPKLAALLNLPETGIAS